MAGCLQGSNGNADNNYIDMELANKQQGADGPVLNNGAGALAGGGCAGGSRSGGGGGGPSKALLAALGAALLLSLVSLVVGAYALATTRGDRGSYLAPGGAVLTSSARGGPAGAVFGGSIFAGSGYYVSLGDMKYSRSDFHAIPVGAYVYVMGGLTDELGGAANVTTAGRVIPNLVRYDTYTNEVIELAPMPRPRSRFAAALLGTDIYIISGIEAATDEHMPLANAFKYSTTTNKWTVLPGQLNIPRSDACAAALDGKIYVMGGYSKNYTEVLGGEVMDLATGTWQPMPDGMVKRGDCESVALPDCIFVAGGWAGDFSNVAECFRPSTGRWERKANMTHARGDFAMDALPNNRVIVFGGETSGAEKGSNEYAMHHVEEYIMDDDVWVPRAPLPQARFRFDAAHVDNRVYVFGGHPTCASDPKEPNADGRPTCVRVALNKTVGYFDMQHPNVYVWTKA